MNFEHYTSIKHASQGFCLDIPIALAGIGRRKSGVATDKQETCDQIGDRGEAFRDFDLRSRF